MCWCCHHYRCAECFLNWHRIYKTRSFSFTNYSLFIFSYKHRHTHTVTHAWLLIYRCMFAAVAEAIAIVSHQLNILSLPHYIEIGVVWLVRMYVCDALHYNWISQHNVGISLFAFFCILFCSSWNINDMVDVPTWLIS